MSPMHLLTHTHERTQGVSIQLTRTNTEWVEAGICGTNCYARMHDSSFICFQCLQLLLVIFVFVGVGGWGCGVVGHYQSIR